MTRVVVTSDLHLGVTTEARVRALRDRIAAERPDLTVLAGDVGERYPNVARCFALFSGLPGQLGVLAGNHDVWARAGRHSRDLLERDLPIATVGAVHISVVPSAYGNPAYIMANVAAGAVAVSVVRAPDAPAQRLANLARTGAGRVWSVLEITRRKVWPSPQ